ncbi:MAG: hypothetical protein ACI8PZ_002761 [Myxococcota bacterium]|jgi:hypothetical protein
MTKHAVFLMLIACGGATEAPAEAVLAASSEPVAVSGDTAEPVAPPPLDEPVAMFEDPPEVEVAPLVVDGADPLPLVHFKLRRGETLAHFARWAGFPVEVVAEASGLDLNGAYPVGTEVMLPLSPEARSRVELRRTEHHVARADGYLHSRGGVAGTDFYTVRTGDSAWTIARDELGIPVWLLETYNPSVDLDALRPGIRLMVPALADTVADAGAPALPLERAAK